MTTSAIPATINYLVSTFRTASTLGAADPAITIFDGPEVTDLFPQLSLWVGMEDPDNSKSLGAESIQQWMGLGSRIRNEEMTIHCAIGVWNGEVNLSLVRTSAFNILAAVEDIVRANASLGGNILFVDPGVTDIKFSQYVRPNGAVARITFAIVTKARIGG